MAHPQKDYLYRISLKCLITDDGGNVLVVKEAGRDWWDIPGGGMDHGEDIRAAIAREMKEEANLSGDFTYRIIDIDDPKKLDKADIWQMRLIFEVKPLHMTFSAGDDSDEITFMDPAVFKDSAIATERRIYQYSRAVQNRR